MQARQWKKTLGISIATSMLVAQPTYAKKVKVVEDVQVVKASDESPSYNPMSPKDTANQEFYPEGALMQVYQEEIIEVKRTEEAERKAIQARDEYEKKKVEAEEKIQNKKFQIEAYKMKQEKVIQDVEVMQVELADVSKKKKSAEVELKLVEMKMQETNQTHDVTKQELEDSRNRLADTVEKLRVTRDKSAVALNKGLIEIQRMRSEISVLEAEIQKADAKRHEYEAQEMKTRSEWMAFKQQIEELNAQKAEYNRQWADAKTRYENSQKELRQAQNELVIAEKEKNTTAAKVGAEVLRLEAAMQQANRSKTMAEAEKMRVESETEKLKTYIMMVRQSKDRAVEEQSDAEGVVMQSKLALETAKAELTKEVARGDSDEFRSKKTEARLRGLASVAEASNMLDGGRLWVSTKGCKLYRRPSHTAQEMGDLNPGRRLVASEASGNWIKLMNTSGSEIFVDRGCGKFEQ